MKITYIFFVYFQASGFPGAAVNSFKLIVSPCRTARFFLNHVDQYRTIETIY